jgi:hypothetical protein
VFASALRMERLLLGRASRQASTLDKKLAVPLYGQAQLICGENKLNAASLLEAALQEAPTWTDAIKASAANACLHL